jgi:thiazole synthase
MKKLTFAGREFTSRLFLGTGKFSSNELMEEAILASDTQLVTVAMKRMTWIIRKMNAETHCASGYRTATNTSGARNAKRLSLPHKWHVKPLVPIG